VLIYSVSINYSSCFVLLLCCNPDLYDWIIFL